jgi:hypothetical protein
MYVIKRIDQGGGYVARPGNPSSYTNHLDHVRFFKTREEAESQRCPENEVVVSLEIYRG